MNVDVEPVQELLSSFSRVNGLAFELRDEALNRVFTSLAPCPVRDEDGRRVAGQVVACGKPRHRSVDGAWICGVPVRTGPSETCCLAAFPKTPLPPGTPPPSSDHVRNIKYLLVHIGRLIEARALARDEEQKLTEELERSYEDLYLFSRIAIQLKALRFAGPMLKELARDLLETMRADMAAVEFTDRPQLNVLVEKEGANSHTADPPTFMRRLTETMPAGATAFDDHCFLLEDSRAAPPFDTMGATPFRCLCVEIHHEEHRYGWLTLVSFNMDEIFRRGEYRLVSTLAEQLALVMANSDLYQELELFVINLVKAMIQALEAKDPYTRGHSERVSGYCMRMAEHLGLEQRQRQDLEWASMLHDLGKIGISESILGKPGRLTPPEFEAIQAHPSKGSHILKPISQLSNCIAAIRHHHERYDGKGYPDGLAGEDVPLFARIIAVADTFDAVTSNRPYRGAMPRADAIKLLEDCAGTQLDARLVAVFLQVLRNEGTAPGSGVAT